VWTTLQLSSHRELWGRQLCQLLCNRLLICELWRRRYVNYFATVFSSVNCEGDAVSTTLQLSSHLWTVKATLCQLLCNCLPICKLWRQRCVNYFATVFSSVDCEVDNCVLGWGWNPSAFAEMIFTDSLSNETQHGHLLTDKIPSCVLGAFLMPLVFALINSQQPFLTCKPANCVLGTFFICLVFVLMTLADSLLPVMQPLVCRGAPGKHS